QRSVVKRRLRGISKERFLASCIQSPQAGADLLAECWADVLVVQSTQRILRLRRADALQHLKGAQTAKAFEIDSFAQTSEQLFEAASLLQRGSFGQVRAESVGGVGSGLSQFARGALTDLVRIVIQLGDQPRHLLSAERFACGADAFRDERHGL